MAKPKPQDALNSHFALEQADLQTRLLLLEDTVATLEKTLSALLDHLQTTGSLPADAELTEKWQLAMALLRDRGWKDRSLPGEPEQEAITCPGCSSLLRNVSGDPGDRCDWCGHVFVLSCPACGKELEKLKGEPGETCLWCQHQF